MIFIDANIPMYLVGKSHPNKTQASKGIEELLNQEKKLVTNVEVFQEILHRYTALHRRSLIDPTFELLHRIVDEIFSIDEHTIELARETVLAQDSLSARHALHFASMRQHKIKSIFSFNAGFDRLPGIKRVGHI